MNKTKTRILLGMLGLSLLVPIVAISPADASSWHTGTPKVLRGNWYRTKHAGTGSNRFSFKTGVKLSKTNFSAYGLGDPFVMNHLKYKKLSKKSYVISGIEYLYSKDARHVKITKSGHKLKWRTTYPAAYKYSYSQWFTKH